MPRQIIAIPNTVRHTCSINVRITDINYGNHLGNDALLGLIHEARLQLLSSIGCSELSFFDVALIMGDVAINFKGESFYNDLLQFEMEFNDLSRVGFTIYYKITNQNKRLIAEARTGMICFDYSERKVVSVPNAFLEFISAIK